MRIEAMLCWVFNIPRAPGPHNPLVAVGLRTVDSGRRGQAPVFMWDLMGHSCLPATTGFNNQLMLVAVQQREEFM